VLVDVKHPSMRPLREPIRSLVFVAGDRAIADVFVDGEQVVRDGKVLTMDLEAASDALEEAQKRSMKTVPKLDWAHRTTDELAPMVFDTAGRVN
jgi:cytosine/adenosine deaminase-related metal-dependent hydrolase